MSWLSSIVRDISPVVATVASVIPTPAAQATAAVAGNIARQTEKRKIKEQIAEREKQMEIFGSSQPRGGVPNIPIYSPPVSNANSGSFFGGVSDFFSSAGNVIGSAFNSGIPQLLGVGRPQGVGQQPAVTSVTNVGARETQGSGTIQAGFGAAIPGLVSGARSFLKSPMGQAAFGGGAALGLSMLGADGKPMRVTRKMKAQARQLLNMTGGNLALTADFLGISEQQLVMVLLKRFRNDGPVVTKAALRKTKSTVRRLKSMCDMYDDLRPAARRRTPMRRAKSSTTLIKN